MCDEPIDRPLRVAETHTPKERWAAYNNLVLAFYHLSERVKKLEE